jgi:hypothetical protein
MSDELECGPPNSRGWFPVGTAGVLVESAATSELLRYLLALTIASSVAILATLLIRGAVRLMFGADALFNNLDYSGPSRKTRICGRVEMIR